MNAVVENTVRICATDPGKPGVVEMLAHFRHFHLRVAIIHVGDVHVDQLQKTILLRPIQLRHLHTCIVEDNIVLPRFGEIVVAGLSKCSEMAFVRWASGRDWMKLRPSLCSS